MVNLCQLTKNVSLTHQMCLAVGREELLSHRAETKTQKCLIVIFIFIQEKVKQLRTVRNAASNYTISLMNAA